MVLKCEGISSNRLLPALILENRTSFTCGGNSFKNNPEIFSSSRTLPLLHARDILLSISRITSLAT